MPLGVSAMEPSICIRNGGQADATRLAVLASQVWLHTYATDGVTDDIAAYVLHELTPDRYLAALVDTSRQLFVAERDESLVGFAVVKFDAPCPIGGNCSSVELETLYVQEHFTSSGVGKSLLQVVQAKASKRSNSVLWLTVNAKNTRAVEFYARQGYSKVGTTYFHLGATRHENHVLIGTDVKCRLAS